MVLFPSPLQPGDASVIINEKGCVQAGEEWLEQNLVLVAGVLVGIAFMQVDNRDDIEPLLGDGFNLYSSLCPRSPQLSLRCLLPRVSLTCTSTRSL